MLDAFKSNWVKIILEGMDLAKLDENIKGLTVQMAIGKYKELFQEEKNFSISETICPGDDIFLVFYHKVPKEVKNSEDLKMYQSHLKSKLPGSNMMYEGKVHQIKKITGKPVMMAVVLECILDNVLTRKILVPSLFSAGKI